MRETALYLSGYHARELYGVALELDPNATLPRLMSRKNAIAAAESRAFRVHALSSPGIEPNSAAPRGSNSRSRIPISEFVPARAGAAAAKTLARPGCPALAAAASAPLFSLAPNQSHPADSRRASGAAD
ncbi:MAG: hypothetical protein WDO74_32430 [Pseudomonadota bacterium]